MSTTQPGVDASAVARALARAAELLSVAEDDLAAGRDFTLVEFNAILDRACLDAVRLPQSEFKDVRAQLKALLERMEALRRDYQRAAPAA